MKLHSSRIRLCALFFLLLLCGGWALGWRAERPRLGPVSDDLRGAMLRSDWPAARSELTRLQKEASAHADLWTYFEALVLAAQGDRQAAQGRLEHLLAQHAQSPWIHKARFQQAELARAQGDEQAAEAIYESAVGRLRAPDRQREFARIYLDFADALSTEGPPNAPARSLDYQRAWQLYAAVLDLEAPRAEQDWALWRQAYCKTQLSNHADAAKAYEAYLQRFDPARSGGEAFRLGAGQQVVAARVGLARALLQCSELRQARAVLEDFQRDYELALANSGPLVSALAALDEDGKQAAHAIFAASYLDLARTWQTSDSLQATLSVRSYQRFLEKFPTHPRASEAAYAIGEVYLALGRSVEARAAFHALRELEPLASDSILELEADAALRQRAVYQEAHIALLQSDFSAARAFFEEYVQAFPTGAEWGNAQQGLVQVDFMAGEHARKQGAWSQARALWNSFLERHPLDARAAHVSLEIGSLWQQEAQELLRSTSASERTESTLATLDKLWREASAAYSRSAAKYAGSEEASQALYRMGEVMEQGLLDPEAAIQAYRRCTFGSAYPLAQTRLQILTETALSVVTERSVRSTEAASVSVQVRNIEKVAVEIYALDLEAYFRKHLTNEHIADLDLDLITADHKLEIQIAGYRPYVQLEQKIELPLQGPGVWAVTVSTAAERATTLVLRSDLEIIVESTRSEALVFVQDVLSNTPRPGVRILLAALAQDGADALPVVYEIESGSDGVARLESAELGRAQRLQVLAVQAGHFATQGLALEGIRVAETLTPREYVYTDRPSYRPGQVLHWRAILREVRAGAFHFEEGQSWRVELCDPSGRSMAMQRQELSAYGSITGSFELPPEAPVGNWSLKLEDKNARRVSHSFIVANYQLERAEVVLEPERPVYYRGEEVVANISARWYWGEPITGARLHYQLPDGRQGEISTDARGSAQLRLDTRELSQSGSYAIAAALLEEGVRGECQFTLALRGFDIAMQLSREVVLAGENFRLKLTSTTPDQKPIGVPLRLSILRQEQTRAGTIAEVKVAEHEIQTDSLLGEAEWTGSLDHGGRYFLHAEGVDRFGNPVFGRVQLLVSGEEDQLGLRWLIDQSSVKVGEQLLLPLHNRTAPGLALLTIYADRFLGYRVLDLRAGTNEIPLEVEHAHYPNFAVTLAAQRGTRFHSARNEFSVARELKIAVLPKTAVVAPASEVEIELLVHDQLGRPTSAELSLAVVDEALYEIYPDLSAPLHRYFAASQTRPVEVLCASSCSFRYEGKALAIAGELLAERLRAERETQLGMVVQVLEEQSAKLARAYDAQLESLSELGYMGAEPEIPGTATGSDEFYLGRGAMNDRADKSLDSKRKNARSATRGQEMSAAAQVPSETAYFSATIQSDASGRALVRFPMPDRSTRWRISCKGVSRESLFGDATAALTSRAEYMLSLERPDALTEGDAPRLLARLHKPNLLSGKAELLLRVRGLERELVLPATLDFTQGSTIDHLFEAIQVDQAGTLECELLAKVTLDAQEIELRTTESIPVRPWGIEERVAKSGILSAEQSFELALPEGVAWHEREIEISLGANVDRMLIDEALRGSGYGSRWCVLPEEGVADTASLLEGLLVLAEALEQNGRSTQPEVAELRSRAATLLARLIAAQSGDGGWTLGSNQNSMHVQASARVARALGIARQMGLNVPPSVLDAAADYLRKAANQLGQGRDETRAMIVAALAANQAANFDQVSRLHRDRAALSSLGLAYLSLALADLKREPMAREVAEELAQRAATRPGPAAPLWDYKQNTSWNRSELETDALILLALERSLPSSARIAEGVSRLLAARPWFPTRARGAVIAAIARYQGETEPAQARLRIQVAVADLDQRTLSLEGSAQNQSFRLTIPDNAPKRLRIQLRLEGRGRPSFVALLSGFTHEVEARAALRHGRHLRSLAQHYLAPPGSYLGRTLPEGFSIVPTLREQWSNPLRELALGHTATANLSFYLIYDNNVQVGADRWGTLEIPLPAGADLLEGSLQGSFLSWRKESGRLLVQLGELSTNHNLSYSLVGTQSGVWRTLPPTLWDSYSAELLAVAEALPLQVLPRGVATSEQRRITPLERYTLGVRAFEAGERELARRELGLLWEEYGELLEPQAAREAARILFQESVATGDVRATVRFFELLKERFADLTIPFDRVIAVGQAYRQLEDYERASIVFRTVIEETYGKDLKVVGTLESQGELAGALDVLERLWLEYPDLPVVRESEIARADKLFQYAQALELPQNLREAGRNRTQLAAEAVQCLERFCALYPADPLAPDAALALVSLKLELEQYERAAELSDEVRPIYSDPRYLDAFSYSQAVAQWYLGQDQQALQLLEQISNASWTDANGVEHPSANRDLALYILGQIHHAQRNATSAAEYYARVEHLFVDAREALSELRRKSLALDEVTTARPGAVVELELRHKNIDQVEILVYDVDLMTLTLREKNLARITEVNLAGIAPALKQELALNNGNALGENATTVQLELPRPGAYLAICRGHELFASGLVLVTELELSVRDDQGVGQGRVRVEALRAGTGEYLRNVEVRVIGSKNSSFFSGKTDPRGLYTTDGVHGACTVIARLDERHYAFHRGAELELQVRGGLAPEEELMDQNYFKNVLDLNRYNNEQRQQRLQTEIQRDRSGVQLKQLK